MPVPMVIAAAARLAVGVARGAMSAGRALASAGKTAGRGAGRIARKTGARFSMKHGADAPGPDHGGAKKRASAPSNPRDGQRESALNRLWSIDTTWSLAERMTSLIGSSLPTFIHAITVSTIGGPGADLRRIWYLTCAAAFGRYRNRAKGIGEANMEAVWDVTGKATKVSIAYTLSGIAGQLGPNVGRDLIAVVGDVLPKPALVLGGLPMLFVSNPAALVGVVKRDMGITPAGDAPTIDTGTEGGIDLLQQGPDQVTIGDGWPTWLRRGGFGGLLPDAIKIGTGTGAEYALINEECDKDYFVVRFKPLNRDINVYGELPRTQANKVLLPYGQIVPVDGTVQRAPTSTREKVIFRGREYVTSPRLPDDGRLITTGEKRDSRVQPPRPWVDGKSRMNDVVGILANAIHNPCTQPHSPGCSYIPLGGSAGSRLYPAGQDKRLSEITTPAGRAEGRVSDGSKIPHVTD